MQDDPSVNDNKNDENDQEELDAWIRERYQEDYKRNMQRAARLLERRKGDAAITLLEPILRHEPENVDVIVNLSSAYILAKSFGKAVELLENATANIAPDEAVLWSNLGAAYLGTLLVAGPEEQRKALTAYNRVLELDETFPNTYYNIGMIHFDRREWEKADQAFANAVRVNPHDRDARLWRQRIKDEQEGDHSDE